MMPYGDFEDIERKQKQIVGSGKRQNNRLECNKNHPVWWLSLCGCVSVWQYCSICSIDPFRCRSCFFFAQFIEFFRKLFDHFFRTNWKNFFQRFHIQIDLTNFNFIFYFFRSKKLWLSRVSLSRDSLKNENCH